MTTCSEFLVRNGVAQGGIALGPEAPACYAWLASELQRYLRQLTGAELPLGGPGVQVTLGGPAVSPAAARAEAAGLVHFADLPDEGFVITSAMLDGVPHLFLGGNDARATMYAVYEFLERCGIVFHLTGDIIPATTADLPLEFDVRQAPAIRRRGLHMRHFVMPWMGLADFRAMIDQMAKMKMNYLEFYWYVGAPWIDFRYQGVPVEIGDVYHRESGYTAWRIETYHFGYDDVAIGRELFSGVKPCAAEFQGCETPADACRVAEELLHAMIAYAHERQIEVWLGTGDCPSVPPNLGALCRPAEHAFLGCPVVPPGDPDGLGIWQAMLDSMATTYPEADGYWVWLAELYFHADDAETRRVLARYDSLRPLIPSKAQIMAMGYDAYVEGLDQRMLVEGDLGLVHYGTTLAEHFAARHPGKRLGLSVLGRAYLFPALHAALPPDVALQSMEACICWNRTSRVPMACFGGLDGRETFLVPRLDDDTNEFAMQFNVGIYHHDRVLAGAREFGLAGVAPQVGRTRGLEHNARYLADGGWDTALTPERFYDRYLGALYGPDSPARRAYAELEENEWALSSMGLDPRRSGGVFEGFNNFCNYADSMDAHLLRQCATPDGPAWDDAVLDMLQYRDEAFQAAEARLQAALDALRRAAPPAGAHAELAYVIGKTDAYARHLQALRALMAGLRAFHASRRTERGALVDASAHLNRAIALMEETAALAAACADHPTERYILFRYNVRLLLPARAVAALVRNLLRRADGLPDTETVDWRAINP